MNSGMTGSWVTTAITWLIGILVAVEILLVGWIFVASRAMPSGGKVDHSVYVIVALPVAAIAALICLKRVLRRRAERSRMGQ